MRLGTTSLSVTKPGPRRRRFLGIYTLSSASNVNEGDTLTVTVNTIGVPSGTVLYWQTTNITTSDSDFTTTSGSVQIINGTGNFTVGAVADSTTEGAETFGITLRRSSPAGPIVASTTNKTINDTSLSPSYSASSPSSVNEGSALVCTVTTTNVADSTTLYWTTSHTSTADADFTANSGSFTINSNSGTFNVTPTADATTEGAETFTVQIRTGSTSGSIVATLPSVTVNDTSPSGWDINNASYDSSSGTLFSIPNGITMSGDGLRIYRTIRQYVTPSWRTRTFQYGLSTAFDPTTASSTQQSFDTISIDGGRCVAWKPDGTKFWRTYGNGKIRQWTVPSSDAWDMHSSGRSYQGEVHHPYGASQDMQWAPDGSKLFIWERTTNNNRFVRVFSVSTAWDFLSTRTLLSTSPQLPSNTWSMAAKPDGSIIYFSDRYTAKIYQHNLSTAWDASTLSTTPTYTADFSSNIGSQICVGVMFNPDGSEFFTFSNSKLHKFTV